MMLREWVLLDDGVVDDVSTFAEDRVVDVAVVMVVFGFYW